MHDSIEKMIESYHTLLNGIVAKPSQPIATLPVLTDAMRHQRVVEWNDTTVDYPRSLTIHQLFERQAALTPQSIALVYQDAEMTYAELDADATCVARHLMTMGVGIGSLVGLYVERSLEMMVGMLAILKAGGAYVPLDPSFPHDRIEYMIADAEIWLILTLEKHCASLPKSGATIATIDALVAGSSSTDSTLPTAHASNLAYVIYTSGSTGRPKGIEIAHSAVVNFLSSMQREPGLTAEDRLLAVTTLSFDISILELFLPLITGATVVIAPQPVIADGHELYQLMRRSEITVMQATPSTWRMLIDAGWHESLPIRVLCGGEGLPKELAEQLLDRCDELWNMYGPTETTIWSSIKKIVQSDGVITVGRPIGNTQMYVLDTNLQLAPVNVSGEIHIGGDGLAQGYLNRDELTQERFIQHPELGQIYKVGDSGRWLRNGEIEILGRLDNQVKIRGFRIELGEIEHLLNRHSAIAEAVVAAKKDTIGSDILVAYYALDDALAANVDSDQLRTVLRAALPEYMIPTVFMALHELPLTPNGKIDRNALPEPTATISKSRAVDEAPSGATEMTVAEIFTRLLPVDKVGATDGFFELGGHSLLSVSLFTQIEQELGIRLPLSSIFQSSSVRALSALIDKQQNNLAEQAWSSLVPIRTGDESTGPTVLLVHPASGQIALYHELANFIDPAAAIFGLRSQGLDGVQPPLGSVDEMVERYASEVLQQGLKGPFILSGYCMGGTVALALANLLKAHGHEVMQVVLIDSINMTVVGDRSSRINQLLITLQKFQEHQQQLMRLDAGERKSYIAKRFSVAKEQLNKRKQAKSQLNGIRSDHYIEITQDSSSFSNVWQMNEIANWKHKPRQYDGDVLLLKQYYRWDLSSSFGWELVVRGHLRTVKLKLQSRRISNRQSAQQVSDYFNEILSGLKRKVTPT